MVVVVVVFVVVVVVVVVVVFVVVVVDCPPGGRAASATETNARQRMIFIFKIFLLRNKSTAKHYSFYTSFYRLSLLLCISTFLIMVSKLI